MADLAISTPLLAVIFAMVAFFDALFGGYILIDSESVIKSGIRIEITLLP